VAAGEVGQVSFLDAEMVLGLLKVAVVLACLAPFVYYTARWYARVHTANSTVSVRERIPLGANRFLYVVEWAGNRYLVAVTNQQVAVIDRHSAATASTQGEGGEQPSFQN
jgi:flagellar biogenesis protein FliO